MTTFAGFQLTVQWKTGSSYKTLDGIQRISYNLVNDVEAKEECGSRYPSYLVEGIYGTTGTLERFYTGSGAWPEFKGEGGASNALPIIDIRIMPNGTASGQPYIQLGGIKMNKIAVNHRPGSNLMTETWDFIGTGSLITGTNGS